MKPGNRHAVCDKVPIPAGQKVSWEIRRRGAAMPKAFFLAKKAFLNNSISIALAGFLTS